MGIIAQIAYTTILSLTGIIYSEETGADTWKKGEAMSDYINREDAIKAFDPNQRRDWYTPWIVETLKDLPSADVAPVRHGRWIECTSSPHWKCSMCGTKAPIWFDEFNEICEWLSVYCPNCGAKMDGGGRQ